MADREVLETYRDLVRIKRLLKSPTGKSQSLINVETLSLPITMLLQYNIIMYFIV